MLLAASLAAAALARADTLDPSQHFSSVGQAAARAALLPLSMLGSAWADEAVAKPYTIKIPVCESHPTDYRALEITGHAEAEYDLANAEITVDSDVEVFASEAQVATLFRLMLQPNLDGCLRYDLFKSVGSLVTIGGVERLPLARFATHEAAYRITVLDKVGKREVSVYSDFLFLGQRRTVDFVNVVAPALERSELPAFEGEIARTLVKAVHA